MVGVLIEMRTAVLRRNSQGKRGIGSLVLALFVLALATSTLLSGIVHYHYSGAGADVMATLSFGWLLGWVAGPVLTGDDSTLRLDYFKLLPIPVRKLAYAMMGAAFANVGLVFSLVAFCGLVAYGAQSGVTAALVGVVAVLLYLTLAVVASTVAIAIFGPVLSSRRGRDFGSFLVAIVITLMSLASGLVPIVARKLTNGHSQGLTDVVRWLPSGWGAVAVDAAGRKDWSLVAIPLAGLVLVILALVAIWPPLLRRRLIMPTGGRASKRASGRDIGRPILPSTVVGSVVGKELRLYSRSAMRSLMLMISFLAGVFICVIPALSGNEALLPFAGVMFAAISGACFTNMFGDDGSAFWLSLVVPGAMRAEVRGRQVAWLLVAGPASAVLTLVLTAISGLNWAWPWALSFDIGLVLGAAGALLWISAVSLQGPAPDGGPSPARVLKVHIALVLLPVATLWPAALLLILGGWKHHTWIQWTAVPVELIWSWFLYTWGAKAALGRLESKGPELFAKVRGHVSA